MNKFEVGVDAARATQKVADRCTNLYYDALLKGGTKDITREQFHACLSTAAMQGFGAGFIHAFGSSTAEKKETVKDIVSEESVERIEKPGYANAEKERQE